MLIPHRFALLHGNYQYFWDKVLTSQAASPLGQRIMAADSKGNLPKTFKALTLTHGTILYHVRFCVSILDLQLEIIRSKNDHPKLDHLGRTKLTDLIT